MKKQLGLSIIALTAMGALHAAGDACDNISGKTHFVVQPHYSNLDPKHLSGYRTRYLEREDGIWGSLQFVVFGGKTTERHSSDWGIYFHPCNKCELVVANGDVSATCSEGIDIERSGSEAFLNNKYDIFASHFGITNNDFQSIIRIIPQQSAVGGAVTWKHAVSDEEDYGWGYEVILPVLHVRNYVNLFEDGALQSANDFDESGDPNNMTSAFNREALCHQKITECCVDCDLCPPCCNTCNDCDDCNDCCNGTSKSLQLKRSQCCNGSSDSSSKGCCDNDCCDCDCCNTCLECDTTALANAQLLAFYDWHRGDDCRFQTNFGIIFPTTDDQPSVINTFPPIAGHRHVGLQWGHSIGFKLWEDDEGEWLISAALDLRSGYLFRRTECRTLELCGKPWSRYMKFYANKEAADNEDAPQPGGCFLTLPVEVTPRTFHESTFAWIFDVRSWTFELGFHSLCRQSEKIELCKGQNFEFGIAGSNAHYSESNIGATQSSATINHVGPAPCDDFDANGEPTFIPVRQSDINLNSAAHPTTISHEVYGAINYNWDDVEYPTTFGIGGSFSFSADNTAAHRWAVWGKLIVSV